LIFYHKKFMKMPIYRSPFAICRASHFLAQPSLVLDLFCQFC
jgi:hypothetical protein